MGFNPNLLVGAELKVNAGEIGIWHSIDGLVVRCSQAQFPMDKYHGSDRYLAMNLVAFTFSPKVGMLFGILTLERT